MSMAAGVAFICSLFVLGACIVLVFHPDYDDGFFGRLALCLIGVASFSRAVSVMSGTGFMNTSSIGLMLWLGLAIFFARHLSNFLRRAKRKDRTWYKTRT